MSGVPRHCPENITVDMVRALVDYEPDTGVLRWRGSQRRRGWVVAPKPHREGYLRIYMFGCDFGQHRVAWMHFYGKWPSLDIDHINGDRADNRICNLREVTHAHNNQNRRAVSKRNKSGVTGVRKAPGKSEGFVASIGVNGCSKYLGTFRSLEEAVSARQAAEARFHPGKVEVTP